eukprot:TRINITY_DN43221_c0_g1_i1.p1 TRINITY_DN43221_c0_g1~~TRINITY_DN43221_c0_g1_i1.p1  ORF type:complete len:331 (+),score=16.76 TRINITY_DN43221_c0_g1_i1:23-994(+)
MQDFDLVFVISGCLGAIGAVCIILTYALFKEFRSDSWTLLLFLSICDLAQALFFCVYIGPWLKNTAICRFHHLWGVASASSSFLWTCCIAYHVWRTILNPREPASRLRFALFHLISWGYPAGCLLVYIWHRDETQWPFEDGQYGWFVCIKPERVFTFTEYLFPLIVAWLFTGILYTLVSQKLHASQIVVLTNPVDLEELQTKFRLIPLIFIVIRVCGLCDVGLILQRVSYPDANLDPPKWLMLARAATDPSQGFFNAIVFLAMTARVRARIAECFKSFRYGSVAAFEEGHSRPKETAHLIAGHGKNSSYRSERSVLRNDDRGV